MKTIKADSQTVEFYERSCDLYDAKTFNLVLSSQWSNFASRVKHGGRILDIGCGTGRDIKHFQNLGFIVDGLEPSKKMATLAKIRTHANIINGPVENIDFIETYDGIWACASLLHVKKESFLEVIKITLKALKYDGVLYISLKEGEGQDRLEDGRLFSYFTKEEIYRAFELTPNAKIIKYWSTTDSAGRDDVTWLNTIIKKQAS